MAAGRPYGPNDPSLMSSLETAVTGARRPGPAELAWNWRWELGLLAVLAVPSGLIARLLLWPPARPWCVSRAWCLITPHRVRAGCVNAWVQTRTGKLPFILATTPMADGERVRLWLRAGLTAADLHAARDVLAAACWATEVRVVRSPTRAQLVTLEVIRTRHPERLQLTPQAWPFSRHGAGDGLGDTEGPDTRRWPGGAVPAPRSNPEEGLDDWRGPAPVPDDVLSS